MPRGARHITISQRGKPRLARTYEPARLPICPAALEEHGLSDPQLLTCTVPSEPLPSAWPSPAPAIFPSQVTSKESPNEPSPHSAAAQSVERTQGSPESLPCLPPFSLACPSLKGGCHVPGTQDGLGAWDIPSSHLLESAPSALQVGTCRVDRTLAFLPPT